MLWKYAVKRNVWLWFHILAGGFLARMATVFSASEREAVALVFFMAIGWEILEYLGMMTGYAGGAGYGNHEITPGKHFFLDAVGDVMGALMMALIVVLAP